MGVQALKIWTWSFEDYTGTSTTFDSAILNSRFARVTQMAWAETEFVGCGIQNCGSRPSWPNMNIFSLVCHYEEKGNILDSEVYQSCSSCPCGYTCDTPGLCV